MAQPARAEGDDAQSGGPDHWRIIASPYTLHYRKSTEHRHVWAIGAERQLGSGWLYGGSYFRNSFGQPSAYVYFGDRTDNLFGKPPLFFQWTGGLLYGYKGKYEDKVPFNHNGYSPGLVFSLGWQFDRQMSVQLNALGNAAMMLQLSYDWR